MFILTVKGYEDEGAFALEADNGERVLLMFEEEDDACLLYTSPSPRDRG